MVRQHIVSGEEKKSIDLNGLKCYYYFIGFNLCCMIDF